MKDWKSIARSSGFNIPEPDLDRLTGPLDTLEASFRPLVRDLSPELEPATEMRFGEDDK